MLMKRDDTDNYEDTIESDEKQRQKYIAVVESLTLSLIKKRDIAVAFRAASGVERRWREDEKLFDGSLMLTSGKTDMMDYATGESPTVMSNKPRRSMVEVNIIRSKCETAEGRFSDIMLPTDGKNWGMSVTPVPEFLSAVKDDRPAQNKETKIPILNEANEPVKISDIASNDLQKIKDSMDLMETEVSDQFVECNYNAENRKLIKASCRLGTGILKGPNVVKKIRKAYQKKTSGLDTIHVLSALEEKRPASEWVPCWNIFPAPETTEDVRKTMPWVFEKGSVRPNELVDLMSIPGYIPSQIEAVLNEDPVRTVVNIERDSNKVKAEQLTVSKGDFYERWEYYGELNKDDLETLGVDTSSSPMAFTLSAVVVMVNDKPIKIMLNSLDTGDLPYDFFQWTQISGSPWGIGLPRMMMWLQRIMNGAMRAMMDNAGDSSGVNVIIGGEIEPVDNKWELTGKKLWRYIGDDPQEVDVRKLFAQFQVANNQIDLQNIIELVFKLLDLETGIPMIFSGEQQKIPETLGATNIMVDASNVSLRSRVKLYDDDITKPHVTKYYHWNMQYNDKENIKGDYTVDPKGASELLEKDNHLKFLTQIMQYKNDPDFTLRIDWDKAIKEFLDIIGLDIVKSDEAYKQAKKQMEENPPPVDPRVQTANIKAEIDMNEIKAKGEIQTSTIEAKTIEAQKDRDHAMQMKLIERDLKMMEFAEKRGMTLDQIKGKLSSDTMKLKTQIALTNINGKAPQVTKPVVEPPGRAPDGEAFTK